MPSFVTECSAGGAANAGVSGDVVVIDDDFARFRNGASSGLGNWRFWLAIKRQLNESLRIQPARTEGVRAKRKSSEARR
jgi:hypothetical protein